MPKIDTLYQYIAYDLRSNVWVYPASGEAAQFYSQRIDMTDNFYTVEDNRAAILHFMDTNAPVIVQVGDRVLYGLVHSSEAEYVIGPALCVDGFDLRCRISDAAIDEALIQQMAPCSLTAFASRLLLLYNFFCEKEMTLQECLMQSSTRASTSAALRTELSQRVYVSRESNTKHNPYDHEQREMYAIESGDLTQLKTSWEEQFAGSYGITSKDEIRNGRNLAIIVVALATRAAIRGGVLPEIAMSLGDVYMQRIDEIPNIMEVGNLTKAAEYELTELVIDAKKRISEGRTLRDNPVILRCKDYVYTHLHSKLTVKEIAGQLGVHPNYLSSAFKKDTGISLYQYIMDEKISLVRNLLTYSDYSFSEIASTLGFSSQSHLGSVFKQDTGMTLMEYRRRYRRTEV